MTDGPRPEREHWFEPLAEHMGSAYLRYSFTKGTEQEVAFLVGALGLAPDSRVLDVGCGPGRHAHALGRLGMRVHGVDISARFVELATEHAPAGVTFERADATRLAFDAEFDAAISVCQGAFGLPAEGSRAPLLVDLPVLQGMARAVKSGGSVAVSAFSAYFLVHHLMPGMTFDAASGVNHERTVIKDEAGRGAEHDLWTGCFTPREIHLLCAAAALELRHLWSVRPGEYGANPVDLDHEELLLIATRPA